MDKNKIKLEHFANIVAIAAADGTISEEEMELLQERAIEYGLQEVDVQKVISDAQNLKFVIPMNNEEREEQLSEAVLMSMIDGQIAQKEYDLCLKIAEKLGFDRKYLDYIIKLSQKLSE